MPFGSSQIHPPGQSQVQHSTQPVVPNGSSTPGYPGHQLRNGSSSPGYPAHLVAPPGPSLTGHIGHRVPISGPSAGPREPQKPILKPQESLKALIPLKVVESQEPTKPINHRVKVDVVNSASRNSAGYRVAQVVANRQSLPQKVHVDIPTPSRQQVSPAKNQSPPRAPLPQQQSRSVSQASSPQSSTPELQMRVTRVAQEVLPQALTPQSPSPELQMRMTRVVDLIDCVQDCVDRQGNVLFSGTAQPCRKLVQQPQQPLPVASQQQNDCGCGWFSCPFCKGGKIPEMDVSCVSLGSWCGVSQCLRGLKFRTAAFPFDWNRISMDGLIHFLENKFEDFLQWQSTQDFPWDPDHGGKAYCGKYHSFWHDDLSKPEEVEKYKRRIDRFLKNPMKKLLFIRAVNELAEVSKAEKLLEVLKQTFPDKEIWLLLIVDHQAGAGSYMLESTEGRLMIHLTDKRHIRTWMYYDDVKAYEEAVLMALGTVYGRPLSDDFRPPRPVKSVSKLIASLEPFYSGNTQCETWDPKPLIPQPTVVQRQILSPPENVPQATVVQR